MSDSKPPGLKHVRICNYASLPLVHFPLDARVRALQGLHRRGDVHILPGMHITMLVSIALQDKIRLLTEHSVSSACPEGDKRNDVTGCESVTLTSCNIGGPSDSSSSMFTPTVITRLPSSSPRALQIIFV